MKITVEMGDIKIVVEESDVSERTATIRYNDQNDQIQSTIKVMAEECVKLKIAKEKRE